MSFVLWEILIPLIIAFLLGLLFGWLWWGWRRTKITYTEWETMRQKASRASSVEAEAELSELRAENERLQSALEECESSKASAADLGTGVLGVSGAAAVAAAADSEEADSDDAPAEDVAVDEAAAATEEAPADEAPADEPPAEEAAPTEEAPADDAAEGDAVIGEERHPYGEGSHAPFADDPKRAPEGFDIKGNADSMLYHRTDSRSYKVTVPEVWFDTEASAQAAGFELANTHPTDD